MSTLCQWYAQGEGPCRRWLALFDVKHIFHILIIKSESKLGGGANTALENARGQPLLLGALAAVLGTLVCSSRSARPPRLYT